LDENAKFFVGRRHIDEAIHKLPRICENGRVRGASRPPSSGQNLTASTAATTIFFTLARRGQTMPSQASQNSFAGIGLDR
jgi:hypothetical protein